VEFRPEYPRQLVTELLEPGDHLRDLRLPLLDVDGERGRNVGRRQVEPCDVERVRRGVETDRALHRARGALDALADPLEYPRILPEAGPQEAAVVAAPEPVDIEDGGQLAGVADYAFVHLDPVPEVVPGVVAIERHHGNRVVDD